MTTFGETAGTSAGAGTAGAIDRKNGTRSRMRIRASYGTARISAKSPLGPRPSCPHDSASASDAEGLPRSQGPAVPMQRPKPSSMHRSLDPVDGRREGLVHVVVARRREEHVL